MIASLSAHLAEWLRSQVPSGFRVESDTQGVLMVSDVESFAAGVDMRGIIEQPHIAIRDGISWALHAALATVQDFIAEDLTEPWPECSLGYAMPRVEFGQNGSVSAGYAVNDVWIIKMPDFSIETA